MIRKRHRPRIWMAQWTATMDVPGWFGLIDRVVRTFQCGLRTMDMGPHYVADWIADDVHAPPTNNRSDADNGNLFRTTFRFWDCRFVFIHTRGSKVEENINTQRKFTIQVGTCEAHSPGPRETRWRLWTPLFADDLFAIRWRWAALRATHSWLIINSHRWDREGFCLPFFLNRKKRNESSMVRDLCERYQNMLA